LRFDSSFLVTESVLDKGLGRRCRGERRAPVVRVNAETRLPRIICLLEGLPLLGGGGSSNFICDVDSLSL